MSELFSIVYDVKRLKEGQKIRFYNFFSYFLKQGHKITDIQKKTDEGVEDAKKGRINITEAIKKKKKAEKVNE